MDAGLRSTLEAALVLTKHASSDRATGLPMREVIFIVMYGGGGGGEMFFFLASVFDCSAIYSDTEVGLIFFFVCLFNFFVYLFVFAPFCFCVDTFFYDDPTCQTNEYIERGVSIDHLYMHTLRAWPHRAITVRIQSKPLYY